MAVVIKDYSDTTYITGMRAYAVLAVVLLHSGGAGLRSLGVLGGLLADLGRGGVYVFFVISGFSVAASYRASGGYGRYLFLRYLRLAPLYYAWLLVFAVLLRRGGYWALVLGTPPWGLDLALHLAFLHGFALSSANSIIGVEWSLSVEMFWYLWLPGMLAWVERGKAPLLLTLAALCQGAVWVYSSVGMSTDRNYMLLQLWHPLAFAVPFALGVWAHEWRRKQAVPGNAWGVRLAFFVMMLYLFISFRRGFFFGDQQMPVVLATFLLLLYGSSRDALCRALFMPRPALMLGTLSYGIYLAHMLPVHFIEKADVPVLRVAFFRFLAVATAASALSYATYALIELPAQRWSKRLWPHVNKS